MHIHAHTDSSQRQDALRISKFQLYPIFASSSIIPVSGFLYVVEFLNIACKESGQISRCFFLARSLAKVDAECIEELLLHLGAGGWMRAEDHRRKLEAALAKLAKLEFPLQIFGVFILGCIKTKVCKQICV